MKRRIRIIHTILAVLAFSSLTVSTALSEVCKNPEIVEVVLAPELVNQLVPDATGSDANPTPGVLDSSLEVSALAGRTVGSVEVFTNVTNTGVDDIGMRLFSPAGTQALLTEGNLSSNFFAGTRWSDKAFNAVREVDDSIPLSGNGADSLSPMQAFGLFRGENPNGAWTLRVSDNLVDEEVRLLTWYISIETCEVNPLLKVETTTFGKTENFDFNEDNGVQQRVLEFLETTSGSICGIQVNTKLEHERPSDLAIRLVSPSGQSIPLSTNNAFAVNNAFSDLTFSDFAPVSVYDLSSQQSLAQPEHPLSAFYGANPVGAWVLEFEDELLGDSGTFLGWSITVDICGEVVVVDTTPDRVAALEAAIKALKPLKTGAKKKRRAAAKAARAAAIDAYNQVLTSNLVIAASSNKKIRKSFRIKSTKFRKFKRRALRTVRGLL